MAAGIVFLALFSTFFAQATLKPILQEEYQPRPGRIADKAIEIAMQDTTLQQLFKGREIEITLVRDWGISSDNCPISWCAVMLFDDKSDDVDEGLASASVNVKAGKVVDISLHRDILIKRANMTEEASYFLSKYQDSEMDVLRRGTEAIVTYTVTRLVEIDNDIFEEKKLVLAVIYDKSDGLLMEEPSDMKIYCTPGTLSIAPSARGENMISRIDNEGCFG